MFNSDLDALVPMLCVTLTALATMGTEAFRGRNERLPIGWWGLIGLGGAALSAGLLWNRNVEGFGVIVATFPVILFVFLAYRMYLKNVEMSIAQAEQAEQYARVLEERSNALLLRLVPNALELLLHLS